MAQRAEHGGDMAVRQGTAHDDALLVSRRGGAALEECAQSLDEFARPIRKVGDCAFLDLCAIPIALAQKDRGWRIPVRDGFDIHGEPMPQQKRTINYNITNYMATF